MFQPEWAPTGRREVWSARDEALQVQQVEHLAQEISEGNCVAFVGAGPSRDAGYPGWHELAERLGQEAGISIPAHHTSSNEGRLHGEVLQDFAEECRVRLGEEAYHNFLRREFHPAGKQAFVAIHSYLLRIPFTALITTNFDPCLEEAGRPLYGEPLQVWSYPSLEIGGLHSSGPPPVYHLHGVAYDNAHDPESRVSRVCSLVLTKRDYEVAYVEGMSPIVHLLHEVLLHYTAVFLGVGFDDPSLVDVLKLSRIGAQHLKEEAVRCGQGFRDRTHFALLPVIWRESKEPPGELVRDTDKETQEAETWPTERRISVIRYQRDDTIGYTKLTDIVKRLGDAIDRAGVGELSDDWAHSRREG